jgi:hypothetical protein
MKYTVAAILGGILLSACTINVPQDIDPTPFESNDGATVIMTKDEQFIRYMQDQYTNVDAEVFIDFAKDVCVDLDIVGVDNTTRKLLKLNVDKDKLSYVVTGAIEIYCPEYKELV